MLIGSHGRWWFQIFCMFTPKIGEMIQFDEHIFQFGCETTNQSSQILATSGMM